MTVIDASKGSPAVFYSVSALFLINTLLIPTPFWGDVLSASLE
ncbi:hypothetical protein CZ787_08700 [Halomonas citrativorans]|uniref:Uncharacterized protein n=1 Tax=Halomonas citrativorans TaxID=2742612 RepID=A0A1R4HZ07_9GAMM|nr:hypothetical protein CZ787_08700 [Halomonas citrativorans]